jgi:hypothetical protein
LVNETAIDPPSSLAMSHRVARGIGQDDALIRAQQQPGTPARARAGWSEMTFLRIVIPLDLFV